ncbi:hypothetical protein K8R66_00810 [bacterium]|nr:hypothetical protein [bacterium]
MKKSIILSLAVFMIFTASLFAELNGVLDFGYKNVYVAGSGAVLYDNPVFQQDLILNGPYGLYGIFWSSYSPEKGINSDFGDEVDWILGNSQEIWKLGFDFSYVYVNAWNINSTEADLHIFTLKVDFPEIFCINPYLVLEKDIPFDEDILPGGSIYKLGCSYEGCLYREFTFDLFIAGHDGAFGLDAEVVSNVRVTLNTVFNWHNLEIVPEINYQKSFKDDGLAEDKFWWGVNFTLPLF